MGPILFMIASEGYKIAPLAIFSNADLRVVSSQLPRADGLAGTAFRASLHFARN